MSKKILIVATVQSHICQFHLPVMRALKEAGWEVHVAAKDNLAQKNGLSMAYADKVFDIDFARSPFSLKNRKAYCALKKIVMAERYDVIQGNTPVGGVVARLVGKKARKWGCKTIYLSHGFHFYEGAPKKNWLVYYPIEKALSRMTDALVTINRGDFAMAKKMHAKKNYYIPGMGIDVEAIQNAPFDRARFRIEQGIPDDAVVVLSVGELNDNKNSETLLRAIAKLKDENVYGCFAGNGPLAEHFRALAEELGITDKVRFLGYRRDVPNMCKSADIFCLLSKREGLGLAALEAMACGLPIVTSRAGGIVDYSEDGKTGFNHPYHDVDGIAGSLKKLALDVDLRRQMGEHNREAVGKYDVRGIVPTLVEIYTAE